MRGTICSSPLILPGRGGAHSPCTWTRWEVPDSQGTTHQRVRCRSLCASNLCFGRDPRIVPPIKVAVNVVRGNLGSLLGSFVSLVLGCQVGQGGQGGTSIRCGILSDGAAVQGKMIALLSSGAMRHSCCEDSHAQDDLRAMAACMQLDKGPQQRGSQRLTRGEKSFVVFGIRHRPGHGPMEALCIAVSSRRGFGQSDKNDGVNILRSPSSFCNSTQSNAMSNTVLEGDAKRRAWE